MSDYGEGVTPPPPYGGGPQGGQYGQPQYGQPQQPPQYGQPQYGQPPQPPQYGAPQPFAGGYGAPQQFGGSSGQAADLGQRFLARLIDGFITGAVLMVFYFIVGALFATSASTLEVDENGQITSGGAAFGAGIGILLLFFFVIAPAIYIGYEVWMIATRGATVGKMAMKIKVVRDFDGQIPGWGPSFIRWIFPYGVFVVTCGTLGWLVYLSPVFDQSGRLQGWHDKAAKTLVVKV
jgi:uncharacterized RDD family membrane protein YckC